MTVLWVTLAFTCFAIGFLLGCLADSWLNDKEWK